MEGERRLTVACHLLQGVHIFDVSILHILELALSLTQQRL
jgi:hypothetical protein